MIYVELCALNTIVFNSFQYPAEVGDITSLSEAEETALREFKLLAQGIQLISEF